MLKLDIKTSYCPECFGDNLALYSDTEDGKPSYCVCEYCEVVENLKKSQEMNREMLEVIKDVLQVDKLSGAPSKMITMKMWTTMHNDSIERCKSVITKHKLEIEGLG